MISCYLYHQLYLTVLQYNMKHLISYISIMLFFCHSPVDVVEIGDARADIGDVLKVKPLGALAMIDEGELDWKIVAISLDDPRAPLVNDVNDVEKHFPVISCSQITDLLALEFL